jgi:hypothetical protein
MEQALSSRTPGEDVLGTCSSGVTPSPSPGPFAMTVEMIDDAVGAMRGSCMIGRGLGG